MSLAVFVTILTRRGVESVSLIRLFRDWRNLGVQLSARALHLVVHSGVGGGDRRDRGENRAGRKLPAPHEEGPTCVYLGVTGARNPSSSFVPGRPILLGLRAGWVSGQCRRGFGDQDRGNQD